VVVAYSVDPDTWLEVVSATVVVVSSPRVVVVSCGCVVVVHLQVVGG
jgi:predicted alpha/beta hydrolase family esterase